MSQTIDQPCASPGCQTRVYLERPAGTFFSDEWWAALQQSARCDACIKSEDDALEHQAEREAQEQRRARRRERASLPTLLSDVTWERVEVTLDNGEAVEAAQRWGRGELRGLTLFGDVGVGKTWIAAAAANARLESAALRWYSVPALIAHALGDFKSADRKDAVDTLTGTMAVVLDDIDKVKSTEWVASQLFVAIDTRVQNDGSFLVTTNKDQDMIHRDFGEALADRLFGSGNEAHELGGQTWRQ